MRLKLLLAIKILIIHIILAMPAEASNLKLAQIKTPHVENQPQETLSTSLHNWSTLFSAIITGAAAIFALTQYRQGEAWKKREYLDSKFKEFESKPESINIRKMLSNEIQLVELFPIATEPQDRFVNISFHEINEALRQGLDKTIQPSKLQEALDRVKEGEHPCKRETLLINAAIRDNFNRVLQDLEQFELMIQSNTINTISLRNYLRSWGDLINNINNEKPCGLACKKTVFEYINSSCKNHSLLENNILKWLREYYKPSKNQVEVSQKSSEEEVNPEQVRGAIAPLSMLSHAGESGELGVGSWELGNPANSSPKT